MKTRLRFLENMPFEIVNFFADFFFADVYFISQISSSNYPTYVNFDFDSPYEQVT